jgi:hypothetical protein
MNPNTSLTTQTNTNAVLNRIRNETLKTLAGIVQRTSNPRKGNGKMQEHLQSAAFQFQFSLLGPSITGSERIIRAEKAVQNLSNEKLYLLAAEVLEKMDQSNRISILPIN